MTFGEKLQKLRARAGLSQDQLAELLDVSRQAVSKWERNEAMPEAEKLVRISRQFGVSTDYLLLEEREEPETPKAQTPAGGGGGPGPPRGPDKGEKGGTGTRAICWPGLWRPGAVCGWRILDSVWLDFTRHASTQALIGRDSCWIFIFRR